MTYSWFDILDIVGYFDVDFASCPYESYDKKSISSYIGGDVF